MAAWPYASLRVFIPKSTLPRTLILARSRRLAAISKGDTRRNLRLNYSSGRQTCCASRTATPRSTWFSLSSRFITPALPTTILAGSLKRWERSIAFSVGVGCWCTQRSSIRKKSGIGSPTTDSRLSESDGDGASSLLRHVNRDRSPFEAPLQGILRSPTEHRAGGENATYPRRRLTVSMARVVQVLKRLPPSKKIVYPPLNVRPGNRVEVGEQSDE